MKNQLFLIIALFLFGCSIYLSTYDFVNGNEKNTYTKQISDIINSDIQMMNDKTLYYLYSTFSDYFKTNNPIQHYMYITNNMLDTYGGFENFRIEEYHFTFSKYPDNHPRIQHGHSPMLDCFIRMNLNWSETAIVFCTATSKRKSKNLYISYYFKKNKNKWEVVSYLINGYHRHVCGNDGKWYLEKSRNLYKQKEIYSSFLYKILANRMLSPYPSVVETHVKSGLVKDEYAKIRSEFPIENVSEPIIWEIDETKRISVLKVDVIGFTEEIYVDINISTDIFELKSTEAHDERKKVFDYVAKKYPEYRKNFGGVFVGSVNLQGDGFREHFEFFSESKAN